MQIKAFKTWTWLHKLRDAHDIFFLGSLGQATFVRAGIEDPVADKVVPVDV